MASGLLPEWNLKLQDYSQSALETYGGPQRVLDFPLDEPIVQTEVTDAATLAGKTGCGRQADIVKLAGSLAMPY